MAVVSAPYSAGSGFGRGGWRDFDWWLLLVVVALSVWGCVTIVSATRPNADTFVAQTATATTHDGNSASVSPTIHLEKAHSTRLSDGLKQAMWVSAGLCALLLLTLVDYQVLMHLQFGLYVLNLGLLGLVLKLGREINGAKSWIPIGPFALQPAEFAKFAIIVTLAAFLCRRQEKIREFSTLMWSLAYMAPPCLLILKQPDFGTTVAIMSIWVGMLFFGGARLWHLALIIFVAGTVFGIAWKTDKLKPHQKARLAVFLDTNPSNSEARKAGYQINQSQIAIGSGQITGQGWGKGMQKQAGYVPENTTDFIFTVVAEELGFVGAATLILAYLLLLFRSATLTMTTENYFGVLIAGGFTALIAFHTIINLGMTMRVMPITGVPLPFFSYGGSSYISFSLCVGLLQSIAMRRRRMGMM
ncbi:MAG: rod shape-determining protein RodA [Abitibacteriaceae bacterium]|nr:rod shape-determining protein RodA [Abditibacteriaceae bacterium]MBV9866326.1 rod shape-determining protein RodA [Abditibacteriaceae bacterium]